MSNRDFPRSARCARARGVSSDLTARPVPKQRSTYDRFVAGYARVLFFVLRWLFGAALGLAVAIVFAGVIFVLRAG
jgi:hypothetical protein